MGVSLGSSTLLLVPTEVEARRLADLGGLPTGHAVRATCGFGPVAAAARAAHLMATQRPSRVLLVGIAGTYDEIEAPVGTALDFGAVALHGVGVDEGLQFKGPPAIGFPQWPGTDPTTPRIEDRLELAGTGLTRAIPGEVHPPRPLLLTTCAASGSVAQADVRRRLFPDALAEDMEGFGVALACALAGVPLRIVRGLSNRVGDRRPESWRIPAALAAARRLCLDVLGEALWEPAGSDPAAPDAERRASGSDA